MFSIIRSNGGLISLQKKIPFKNGYSFRHKYDITIYNKNITQAILKQKVNSSIRKILLLLESDDEGTSGEIMIKIETLRNILIENYMPFLGKKTTEMYLYKLEGLSSKVNRNKKSRMR